jgi:hypothetical protein
MSNQFAGLNCFGISGQIHLLLGAITACNQQGIQLVTNSTTLNIDPTPSGWVEKSGTLMAWAYTATTKRATHIGSLGREQTGLKCDCVCPACGGILEAVNAGRPAEYFQQPNRSRPFFRHHTGQQLHGCLVRIAQLAALHLLLSQNEIDLPPPKAIRSVIGASGSIYSAEVIGQRKRALIVERYWIDDQMARITLDDGRVILFQLSGSPVRSEEGSFDALITIRIDDPEVSTWSPEKILEKAELVDKWLCWDRHWLDDELNAHAQARAEEDARGNLDLSPDDLTFPEGMSPLQRSESVLHWVIKEMLAGAGTIRTPEYSDIVSEPIPPGRPLEREIVFLAMQLKLTNVRVEFDMSGMIPDILCTAQNADGSSPPFELMIEVAVTHRVDSEKKSLIEAKGIACIELDVRLLKRSGRVPLEQLREMVCDDPSNKVWISHPEIHIQRTIAKADLQSMAANIRNEREAADKKRKWLEELTREQALQRYFELAKVRWLVDAAQTSNTADLEFREMCLLLAHKGYAEISSDPFILKGAVLWKLHTLHQSCLNNESAEVTMGLVRDSLVATNHSQRYITLILIAIRVFDAQMKQHEIAEFEGVKAHVLESLRLGNIKYARPKTYDAAIALLFPEMITGLSKELGTENYVLKVRNRNQQELSRLDSQRIAQYAATKAAETAETARQHQLLQAELIRHSIAEFGQRVTWMPVKGWPTEVELAIKEVKNLETTYQHSIGMLPSQIIKSAWSARADNVPIESWLASMHPATESDIHWITGILDKAWLVYIR